MSGLQLDFVVYLGDPDEGAAALPSAQFLAEADQHKEQVRFPEAYGAITVTRDGEELVERLPDPVFGLVTNIVRVVQSLIEGEAETQQFSESDHGFSFEPDGDEVLISMFAGDPYEPDDFLLQSERLTLEEFGEQALAMGKRLREILDKVDPGALENDDYLKGLSEFLEVSGRTFKTFRLEKQRGLRV